MAYDSANLIRVAGGKGFSLFVYRTTDTAADLDTSGYFNSAAAQLNIGDIVIRQTYTTTAFTTLSNSGLHVVQSNTGTVVDLYDQLGLANVALGSSVLDTD